MEEYMKKRSFTIFVISLLLLAACATVNQPRQPKRCLENIPKSVAGLKIKGARSEANVIQNMWPIMCKAQEVYRKRLKTNPKLKGTIELKLYVEFNGEIGTYSIVRDTLQDRAVEARILSILQFSDFDPYGPFNSESDIIFPFTFNP
jgi:hypothetical protein